MASVYDSSMRERHVKVQHGLHTPDTSPKRSTYFTGSTNARDYMIDFAQEATSFAPDVQAYLEAVGRCVTGVGYTPYKHTIVFGESGSYVPDLGLVEAGRLHLQSAQRSGAPGIWLSADDAKDVRDAMDVRDNMRESLNYPWLPVLRARGQGFARDLASLAHKASNSDLPMVILGNVRVPIPEGLAGPDKNGTWLNLIVASYGQWHPAASGLVDSPWYTDTELGQEMRYNLGRIGLSRVPEPELPWDPVWDNL